MALQIEVHPRFSQKGLRAFCRQHNIIVVAYASLGCGALLSHSTVQRIAQQCGQTPAQVGLCKHALTLKPAPCLRALHPSTMPGSRAASDAQAMLSKLEQRRTSGAAGSMLPFEFKAIGRST